MKLKNMKLKSSIEQISFNNVLHKVDNCIEKDTYFLFFTNNIVFCIPKKRYDLTIKQNILYCVYKDFNNTTRYLYNPILVNNNLISENIIYYISDNELLEYNTMDYLVGKTITSYVRGVGDDDDDDYDNDTLIFNLSNGLTIEFYHDQDCCESVYIEDINGDLDDLLNSPITLSDKAISEDNVPGRDESEQWTFYRFATVKGYVDVRWYGGSNGYYSIAVNANIYKTENN